MSSTLILWITEEACRDVRLAGGKGASLANMTAEGLPVPPGFVIPAFVLEQSVDADRLRELVQAQDYKEAQELVHRAIPPHRPIFAGYDRLEGMVAFPSSPFPRDSQSP